MKVATTFFICFLLLAIPAPSVADGGWSCDPDSTVPVATAAGNQWNVQLASDNNHGAIVVWQDRKGGTSEKLYVQRIAADGSMLWADGGIPVASTPGNQYYPQILADGGGGAFIVWQDNRGSTSYDIYLQHVSPTGVMLLGDGLPLCTAADYQYYPRIVPSADGGAIVVWQDRRSGNFDIYAQKVNALDDTLWTGNGILVCNTEFDQVNPAAVPDGNGGVIVTWSDFRGGTGFTDVYAQRIRWNGGEVWKHNGVAVSQEINSQWNPQAAADGNSGAIITWQDRRNSFYDLVYAQHFDSAGTRLWAPEHGVPVAPASANQYYQRMSPDGLGGAVVVWQDNRGTSGYDIYAQRMSPDGEGLWTSGGLALSTAAGEQYYPQVVHEGTSFVVAWQDRRNGDFDVYSQRIDLAGNIRWNSGGAPVSNSQSDQYTPQLAGDGFEGAILAWSDFRLGSGSTDIFANRIGSNGLLAGGCFRTFNQDSLSKAGLRIRRTTVAMPNEGNVRDTIFARGVFSQGMIVGVERPDSVKRYGWIYYRKSYYVRRTLPQIGEARGFDRRFDKPFLGILRNPSRYRYNNSVVGELIALKLNIAASDVGITPAHFGDLRFMESGHAADPFYGLSLRDVARRADSMLTYWRSFPGLDYLHVYNSLRRINHAFDGPMDTISLRPLRVTPSNTLFSLDFLVPNTEPPAEIPAYVPIANVPDEDNGFRLSQNYPNPFNPATTIEFTLASPSVVSLKIYDLAGREVAALIDNERLDEGFNAVDYDASNLSTGVYFYRIMAAPLDGAGTPLSLARKMVLIK